MACRVQFSPGALTTLILRLTNLHPVTNGLSSDTTYSPDSWYWLIYVYGWPPKPIWRSYWVSHVYSGKYFLIPPIVDLCVKHLWWELILLNCCSVEKRFKMEELSPSGWRLAIELVTGLSRRKLARTSHWVNAILNLRTRAASVNFPSLVFKEARSWSVWAGSISSGILPWLYLIWEWFYSLLPVR